MIPQTRKEVFYNAILNGGEAPKPVTREEQFWNAILNGTEAPAPITREEMWLSQIAANGGGGGGGGSSPFVEATATVQYSAEDSTPFFYGRPDGYNGIGALVYDEIGEYWNDQLSIYDPESQGPVHNIQLSLAIIDEEAGGMIYMYGANEPVITGRATVEQYYGEWWVTVTGDCTITQL